MVGRSIHQQQPSSMMVTAVAESFPASEAAGPEPSNVEPDHKSPVAPPSRRRHTHGHGHGEAPPIRVHRRVVHRHDRRVPRAWRWRAYISGEISDMVGAVAFNGLVALVPTFLLIVAVAGLLFRRDEVLNQAIGASVWALPFDSSQEALVDLLNARRNTGWFTIASIAGFAWVGSGFASTLGRAMNRIYGAPNRKWAHQRLRGFVLIVGFGVLLAAATIAAALPTLFLRRSVRTYFDDWILATGLGQFISYGISIIIAMLLFLTLYRVVPNAGQRFGDVWRGALFAAAGFVILVQMFPLYIRFVGSVGLASRYGQAFLFVTLLVTWLYLLAHMLLLGTWINARHQHRMRRDRPSLRRTRMRTR